MTPRIAANILGLAALAYCISRGFTLSMTCDEAWSATPLPLDDITKLLADSAIAALNNHLLNSLLMQASISAFGQHDWAARLPAMLGGALYVACACRMAPHFAGGYRAPLLTLLLLANPYLLDFLSLARGYSLGLGFLLLGLAALLRPEGRAWALAAVPLSVAVLANLSFVYPYLAGLGVTAWLLLREARTRGAASAGLHALPSLATLALLWGTYAGALRLAVKQNEHWWGSQAGLVDGSLASFVRVTLYEPHLPPHIFAATAWGLALALAAAMLLGLSASRRPECPDRARAPFGRATALLLLVCGGLVLEHHLFGTPYLVERATLFLHPVMALVFALSGECLVNGFRRSAPWVWAFLLAFAAASAFNTVRNANLARTSTWVRDACADRFMDRLAADCRPLAPAGRKFTLATTIVHEHTARFYIAWRRMDFIQDILPEERRMEADFLITGRDEAQALVREQRATLLDVCGTGDSTLLMLIR